MIYREMVAGDYDAVYALWQSVPGIGLGIAAQQRVGASARDFCALQGAERRRSRQLRRLESDEAGCEKIRTGTVPDLCGDARSEADRSEAIAAYLRRNPGQSFVCVSSAGAIAGAILCGNDGRRAYIHHTAVDPGFRRQGVAKELVRLALERQAQLGIGKCHLMVFAENASGRAFWLRMGFSPRGDLALLSRSLP